MHKIVIGDATLYNGDCRDIIPTLEGVTAVVSDPPYGIAEITGGYGRTTLWAHKHNRNAIANDTNLDCCFEALNLCAGRFQNFRMLAFYSCRLSAEFFRRSAALGVYFAEIIWNKKMPGLTGGGGMRYMHENIAIFEIGEPPPMGDTFSIIDDVRAPILHPHQKPLTLMQTLCNVANGDVVLDPFMGSGSTGVAALKTGRKFIGIELDPGHFATAVQRITEASKQEGLF